MGPCDVACGVSRSARECTSRRGLPFLREQTLTNAVWIGGNNPTGGKDDGFCHLLNCLFGQKGVITPQCLEEARSASWASI